MINKKRDEWFMQESRLFKIVYYLLDKGKATAPDLAEKMEVSIRTIYRDIDSLSGAGIPIYAEPGRNGGIYLKHEFVLDRVVLSEKEKQEILVALQSINCVKNNSNNETLKKLSAIFNMDSEEWLEVDFSTWGNKGRNNDKFELLKSAIIHQKCINITYSNSNGIVSKRIVEPIKMLYKSMSWYLKAFCTEKQDFRIFKLTRIIDIEILKTNFHKRTFPKHEQLLEKEYINIVLCFQENMSYRVYDEFEQSQIKKTSTGKLLVSTNMPEDEWLIGYILSFGNAVEIIKPTYLKQVVAEQAKEIYEKYIT